MGYSRYFIISYCVYSSYYKRGVVGGNFPVFFRPGTGSSWWRYGEFLVAFWGVLGGNPFCNALYYNRLQGQKFLISFIPFIKRYCAGVEGLRPARQYDFILSFFRPSDSPEQGRKRNVSTRSGRSPGELCRRRILRRGQGPAAGADAFALRRWPGKLTPTGWPDVPAAGIHSRRHVRRLFRAIDGAGESSRRNPAAVCRARRLRKDYERGYKWPPVPRPPPGATETAVF